jgi:hypothetical protein
MGRVFGRIYGNEGERVAGRWRKIHQQYFHDPQKSFRKYMKNKTGKHDIKELQKTFTLGTAHTSEGTNVQAHKVYHGK